MEISLAALEGYVIPERKLKPGATLRTELETYGLLWGHEVFLPDGDILYSIKKLTVDAMAYRRNNCVWPSGGLNAIKDMITSYWPEYSFLGDFHSHPYDHYKDVLEIKGYEFSEGDRKSILENLNNDSDFRVSLVATIASLKKSSYVEPQHLSANIVSWTFNNYRFWLNACVTHSEINEDEYSKNEIETEGKLALLPNSSHWKVGYESDQVGSVILNCPYLTSPWPATQFGKKTSKGVHTPGHI